MVPRTLVLPAVVVVLCSLMSLTVAQQNSTETSVEPARNGSSMVASAKADVPVPPVPIGNGSNTAGSTLKNCKNNIDCPTNAECQNNRCECGNEFVMVNGACQKAATLVGENCIYDEQCQKKLGGHSKCDNTICACMTHSVPARRDTICLTKKDLSEQCTDNEQCSHILHGTCENDVCLCDPGFITHNNSCLAVVNKYKENCIESVQCQNGKLGYGSLCKKTDIDTKTCVCETEFVYKQQTGVCTYVIGLGESCDNKNNICYLAEDGENQNIECKDEVCRCKKKYKPSEDNKKCESGGVVNQVSYIVMALSLLMCTTRW